MKEYKEFLENQFQHLMSVQHQLIIGEDFVNRHVVVHEFDLMMEEITKELAKLSAGEI